ncbi:SGNH/GDSL hydrolase family protein [Corynebacterium sp.]|uniref:SGNH/GDSL hydrolase family protein n=1 Tax=Corynebacterium sp. TaxID=1720 RepID=UPI0026DA862F|nr:SGNH/GDSL hydrolase family protein [Corynebacterium sp.]MDO5031985.1 SGNH/GDSL hydrolase family protein [Corynebacterium sp.]
MILPAARPRTRAAVSALMATLALVAGCSTPPAGQDLAPEFSPSTPHPAPAPHASLAGLHYVALGDSYAAMGSRGSTASGPQLCMRAQDNYPTELARLTGMRLEDNTCQGAITTHITGQRSGDGTGDVLPAQAEALSPATDVISLSIGGNDAGFGLLAGCASGATNPDALKDCKGWLTPQVDASLGALPDRLDAVYTQLRERAPHARIITTGYLPLLAASDNCEFASLINATDRQWLVEHINAINHTVAEAAARNGATFVVPERSEEHTGCAPAPQRWTDFTGAETDSFPMHPTAEGQKAMAAAIADALRA